MGYKVWVETQLLDNILSGINRYLVSISLKYICELFWKKTKEEMVFNGFFKVLMKLYCCEFFEFEQSKVS